MNDIITWLKEPLESVKVKGLGKKSLEKLHESGINRVIDLLCWLPRNYRDYSQISPISGLKPDQNVHIQGNLISANMTKTSKQKIPVYEGLIDDGTGTIRAVWFGQKYLGKMLPQGCKLALFGSVQMEYLGLTIVNPHFKKMSVDQKVCGEIQPVYRRISGITSEKIQQWVSNLLELMPDGEWLDTELRSFFGSKTTVWSGLKESFVSLHMPKDSQMLEMIASRDNPWFFRLINEELIQFYLQTETIRKKIESGGHPQIQADIRAIEYWETLLPFCFTGEQRQVFEKVIDGLKRGKRIFSLLQGDVGCGKTAIALGLSILFQKEGFQTAMLCPTTVLARQHFQTAQQLLEGTGVRIALLSSELDRAKQMSTIDDLQSGKLDLVIGTHRLIQADVFFKSLGLIVIDEQHRFGVQQRLQLLKKGHRPHLLSMTATPIPRSLAHSVYGGYEVLQIREKPAGRSEIHTILKKTSNRDSIIPFMKQKLDQGEQIFWVFPFIEGEDPEKQERSVEYMFRQLSQDFFPGFKLGMVHGRMDKAKLQETMQAFRTGATQILFATTVIEVGVDIANATIMVIEGAEHFGLSQLHQLRGRVGRGIKKGFCIMFLEDPVKPETLTRARFFESCQDGFKLAEFDLKQRGAGDFFGNRQTGQSQFKFADLWLDREIYAEMVAKLPGILTPERTKLVRETDAFVVG